MIHYNDNLNINPTGTDDFLTSAHKNVLCFIELRLRLLAAWATPVVGQVFKCHTIVFGRVVQIATHRADIFAGIFLLGEIYLCQYGWYGIVQIHHELGLQVLITLWRVGAAINGRLIANELTYAIHRLASCRQVVIDHRKLVRIQSLVNVGDVALEHIEQALVLSEAMIRLLPFVCPLALIK